MKLSLLRLAAVAAGALALVPGTARAQEDLLATIYTDGGFEVRRDERLFTLFAALNTAGYDRGLQTRQLPFPRQVHHPIRTRLMQSLAQVNGKLRAPVDAFLDAHPQSVEAYLLAALQLEGGPSFTPTGALPKSLTGLDGMLSTYAASAKLDRLVKGLAKSYREELKRVADAANAPFLALRAAYRLDEEEAAMLVIMPNALDAPDSVLAVRTDEDTHVVVLGVPPADVKLDLAPALSAYSALLAREQAEGADLKKLEGTVAKLVGLRRLDKGVTAGQVVADSMQAAVAAKLWSKTPDADVDAAMAKGAVLSRSFYEALGAPAEAFPAEKGSLAAQVIAGFDLEKAIVALDKTHRQRQ